MERTSVLRKPSWANVVLVAAFMAGACVSALFMDDSFRTHAGENVLQND